MLKPLRCQIWDFLLWERKFSPSFQEFVKFGQRLQEIFRKEILSVENSGTEASKATETGHKH